MRRDLIFNEGTAEQARFRVTATKVRREVIVDAPVPPGGLREFVGGDRVAHRMRFTVEEAEAFLALLLEAVSVARK